MQVDDNLYFCLHFVLGSMTVNNFIKVVAVSEEVVAGSGEIAKELAEASPYALILGIVFVMFICLYGISIKSLGNTVKTAIEEMRKAHKDASELIEDVLRDIYRSK